MATCSSCRAEILWGTMRGTGVAMPVDPRALEVREILPSVVALRGRDRLAVVLDELGAMKARAQGSTSWPEWTFHVSHWESCPSAQEHRVNPNQERMQL